MTITVYLDGNKRTAALASDVPGREAFLVEKGAIHLFTTENAMSKWLNASGYSVYYQRGMAVYAKLRRELPVLRQREKSLAQAIEAEEAAGRKAVEQLLKKHRVAPDDSKKFARLIADYVPGRKVRPLSTYLYDGPKYTGSWRWLRHGIQIPKLSWIAFNDMTTSLRVFGENTVLCQHTWWGGARAWFGGHPYWEEDLSGRWWNNRASSVFSF